MLQTGRGVCFPDRVIIPAGQPESQEAKKQTPKITRDGTAVRRGLQSGRIPGQPWPECGGSHSRREAPRDRSANQTNLHTFPSRKRKLLSTLLIKPGRKPPSGTRSLSEQQQSQAPCAPSNRRRAGGNQPEPSSTIFLFSSYPYSYLVFGAMILDFYLQQRESFLLKIKPFKKQKRSPVTKKTK